MDSNANVIIEELDAAGRIWRTCASHMVRANVEQSVAAIRVGYNNGPNEDQGRRPHGGRASSSVASQRVHSRHPATFYRVPAMMAGILEV